MFLFLFVIFLLLVFIYYYKYTKKHEEYWKHVMTIPGPRNYPLIGSNYQLLSAEEYWLIERQRARDFFPIYKTLTLNLPFIVLIHPEDLELILGNTKHNAKSKVYDFIQDWLGTGLLTSKGDKWHKRRKMLTPAFHFTILQEFLEMLNTETQILVENLRKWCHQPYINVVEPVTEFTLFSIGETSLGIPLREDPKCSEYKQAVYDFGELFVHRIAHPWLFIPFIYKRSKTFEANTKVIKTLHNFSTNVIKEKKKAFEKGASYSQRKRLALLDLMLKAKNDGADIDDEGIREELDTFIFEGHDTTSVCLCYTLMVLANYQEIQEEIYQEITSLPDDVISPSYNDLGKLKFMERCIKESLRLYPSVPVIARVAGENVVTKTGYTIPKGCNVTLLIYDMHRNPTIWENPLKFDPDRFLPDNVSKRHPFAYLPFSAGSRNCIGQKFAIMELKVALFGILKNFKLEPYDRPEHMKFKSDLVLRPASEIRVTFVPRK